LAAYDRSICIAVEQAMDPWPILTTTGTFAAVRAVPQVAPAVASPVAAPQLTVNPSAVNPSAVAAIAVHPHRE